MTLSQERSPSLSLIPSRPSIQDQWKSSVAIATEFLLATRKELSSRRPGEHCSLPQNVQSLTWQDLKYNPTVLASLIECYRQGYGAGGLHEWGEGAFCSQHGWAHLVDLPDYETQLARGDNSCPHCSKGALAPCYPPEKVSSKIEHCLTSGTQAQVAVKYDGADKKKVVGFCWGANCNQAQLKERLNLAIQDTCTPTPASEGETANPQIEALFETVKALNRPTLFIDEILISPKFRGGPSTIMDLTRPLLNTGSESGAKTAVCWTSPNSNVFPLLKAIGFTPFAAMGQPQNKQIVFLLHNNLPALAKFVASVNPSEMRKFLVKNRKRKLKH